VDMVIMGRKAVGVIAISMVAMSSANASSYTADRQVGNDSSQKEDQQERLSWMSGIEQMENGWLNQSVLKVTDIADNAKKVPAPAAILLFGPALLALLGLTGLNRKLDK